MKAQRLIGTLILVLATAAVLAGTGQAAHPNDKAGILGVGGAAASPAAAVTIPNDRGGTIGVGAVQSQALRLATAVRPDDRGGPRGPWTLLAASPTVQAVPGDGFQWDDAALGAGAALCLVLLGMMAAMTIRRSRVALP